MQIISKKEFLKDKKLILIDELLKHKGIRDLLNEFVEELPARKRQVIRLRFWSCMDICEISSCLNLNAAIIEKLLSSAINSLKKKRFIIIEKLEKLKENGNV